jgi:hypothetical protein
MNHLNTIPKNDTRDINGGFWLRVAYYTIKFILTPTKVY